MMELVFKKITKTLEYVLVVIFVLLVIDVLWQVFTRYFIGKSSSFTEEISRYLLIWLATLGTAYSRSYKGQMAIDFIFQKFSTHKQWVVNFIIEGSIILFAFFVMIVGGINLMFITLKLGQYSPSLHLPMGAVYSVVPISGVLILFFSIYHIRNYISDRSKFLSNNNETALK